MSARKSVLTLLGERKAAAYALSQGIDGDFAEIERTIMRQHYTPERKLTPLWVDALLGAAIGIGWAYFLVIYL